MADKYIVLDRDSFADEGVTGNLAVTSNLRILLDLYERADLGLITDLASIKIDKLGKLYVFAQFYVGRNTQILPTHRLTGLPCPCLREAALASSK